MFPTFEPTIFCFGVFVNSPSVFLGAGYLPRGDTESAEGEELASGGGAECAEGSGY